METNNQPSSWKVHSYRVGTHFGSFESPPDDAGELRKEIEPWLSAVFQSEHLSLLLGSGFTTAFAGGGPSMGVTEFSGDDGEKIRKAAESSAESSGRGAPNFEDFLRVANELVRGYEILGDERAKTLETEIDGKLKEFIDSILGLEQTILKVFESEDAKSLQTENLLISFLLSFASRAASRERLNLFTTNYDRLIEHGCDLAGIRVVDRFVGLLTPVFRASRLNVDLHYNPPGIRGEPRYLEGVVRLFKLHGSLDWRQEHSQIKRYAVPFGTQAGHSDIIKKPLRSVMVYPNAAKDMETAEYPYAELFRDFAAATCRPNSVLVTFGYGFGDDHVNRVIRDMLTIPSTHLVIISFDDPGRTEKKVGRIGHFCEETGHGAQGSLLLGPHFGDLHTLVENYLPKPAIDLISARKTALLKQREIDPGQSLVGSSKADEDSDGGGERNADTD